MTIESFIQSHLEARMQKNKALLIYDVENLYSGLVDKMEQGSVAVVRADGDLIEARERSLEELRRVGEDATGKAGLVVYATYAAPLDESEMAEDPFSMVGLAGAIFPDGAGDSYRALCLQFLPEQAGRIEELFATKQAPEFSLINSLRSGASDSAILQDLLDAEGPKEMLANFLCADAALAKKLKNSAHWIKDFKDLSLRILGLKLEGQKSEVEDLQATLWRYLLVSEFVADLPESLPPALQSVPIAGKAQEPFVRALCQSLRDYLKTQAAYEEAANRITKELGLDQLCRDIKDFGKLDTFSFEERSFLQRFGELIAAEDYEKAEQFVTQRQGSFWVQRDASRAAEWRLADIALRLLIELSAVEKSTAASLQERIDFYETRFAKIDSLHRELEQVAGEISPLAGPLVGVMGIARDKHRNIADRQARGFQKSSKEEGWPAQCRERAVDVFDLHVESLRKSGKRVAYFWVDALRYELALALEASLARRHKTKIQTVCGQLPGVTAFGMAALLPGASTSFEILEEGGKAIPVVGGRKIEDAKARAEALAAHIGKDRCRVVDLEDAASGRFGGNLETVEVLAIKTTDIDSLGENTPAYFLKLIPEILRKIEQAVNQVADAGFHHALIATDHGFCWAWDVGAGDAVTKPAGQWIVSKDRCLLGEGDAGKDSLGMESRSAGIRTLAPLFACPSGLATYTAGVTYFHGGLSPQESLLPLIHVELQAAQEATIDKAQVNLTYRGANSGVVTTLVPSLELSYPASDLFGPSSVRLIVRGFNKKGEAIARPAASPLVDPTSGEVQLDRGKSIKIPIRIQEGFEGEFTVQASDPASGLLYASLKLTTAFHH
jgi:hypothetical protein